MKVRILSALLLFIPVFVFPCMALMQNQTSSLGVGTSMESSGILLEGTNLIKAPEISFIGPSANWTYPYSYYPIYAEGQAMSGAYLGPGDLTGKKIKVYISNFDISNFLNSSLGSAKIKSSAIQASPNSTGCANFTINGISSGTYTISVVDESNSTVLYALPLIVTPQEIAVDSQAKVPAGGALKVSVKMPPESGDLKRYYGAIMVSRKDYEGIKLKIGSNGSQEGLNSIIGMDNRSIQIKGLPSISTEFLMNLSSILPQNSAIALQNASKPEAEFYLMTDPEWERGDYVLTCAVYSSGKGILGMKQTTVEVV